MTYYFFLFAWSCLNNILRVIICTSLQPVREILCPTCWKIDLPTYLNFLKMHVWCVNSTLLLCWQIMLAINVMACPFVISANSPLLFERRSKMRLLSFNDFLVCFRELFYARVRNEEEFQRGTINVMPRKEIFWRSLWPSSSSMTFSRIMTNWRKKNLCLILFIFFSYGQIRKTRGGSQSRGACCGP